MSGSVRYLASLSVVFASFLVGCNSENLAVDKSISTGVAQVFSDTKKPNVVKLVESSSINPGSLTISWLPATDDNTPHSQMEYQVHLSQKANFQPSPLTLVGAATGGTSADLTNAF